MTVSSGFFNSVNHDRLYDAEQLSSIFDGVIVDGVYENVGEAFNVIAYPDAYNTVLVGTGRAWFDHTWTLNDSRFSITLDPPNEMLGRIDAIVIDVNKERDTRKNSIIYLKGDEATPDFPPTLIDTENHHQYPIAYITRHAEQNGPINQSDIEITVGTGACPIATGVLEAQNLENLMQQLDAEFNEWWDGIKDVLDENTVTKLQNQIDEINERLDSDTALVGLLEKPIAEAFMSGDYGLDVTSFSVPISASENELQNTVTFLPNGEVCSVSIYEESGAYSGSYFIDINITNTSGVNTKQTVTVDLDVMQKSINHWSSGGSSRSGVLVRSQAQLITAQIDSYPAVFTYLATKISIDSTSKYIKFSLITIRISSSGTVQVNYSDSVSPPQAFPGTLEIAQKPQMVMFQTVNSLKTSSGSYICPVIFGSGQSYTEEDTFWDSAACAALIGSDLVISQSSWSREDSWDSVLDSSSSFYKYIPWNVTSDKEKAIAYFYEDQNSDTTGRGILDFSTLGFQFLLDGSGSYPVPSSFPYTVSYGVETYSLSELNGVRASKISSGDSPEIEDIKKSEYFLGATNLCEPLPEGTFIAANEDGRLYGIAATGEQLAIGTNGGTAILKTKKTVSNNIDIQKAVLWLKGYINTETFTEYLMINGRTDTPHSYSPYHGMGDSEYSSKTAFVVKISKGV